MADITLYHMSPSRSLLVLWMLEEVGASYEVKLLSGAHDEQREPGYLAVNPMGKVPALVDRGTIITEAAAICAYLADAFPEAGLAVPIGTPARGLYYKWLFFGPSCLEPAILDRMLKREGAPRGALGWGDTDTTLGVVEAALEKSPYLLGDRFTTPDLVIGGGLRWGIATGAVTSRPAFDAYLARIAERPALKRSEERDRMEVARAA
ncbi:glutathione S-transferase family protein [Propylenella binzhouense]|uniref:Glutathione S-transferase family protein n=1 Tax=Propylenella binzhouense TaxID=2555902 RepID=A0A964T6S2_9HYPH|nr:glutathione S-transferase family protein [Propylenella binzhouense]MYZ48947.1 glutathione S-transferase family protein [Propylenella binzhouense]